MANCVHNIGPLDIKSTMTDIVEESAKDIQVGKKETLKIVAETQ
jgi:hypothetical protein